jgi:hypothetical protein
MECYAAERELVERRPVLSAASFLPSDPGLDRPRGMAYQARAGDPS